MSGGAYEYTAGYNNTDTNNNIGNYGWSGLSKGSSSTKYATQYKNTTNTYSGEIVYSAGKIGEGIKEIYSGSGLAGWHGDFARVVNSSSPFSIRGGFCSNGANAAYAGVFYASNNMGNTDSYRSFRVCLCP